MIGKGSVIPIPIWQSFRSANRQIELRPLFDIPDADGADEAASTRYASSARLSRAARGRSFHFDSSPLAMSSGSTQPPPSRQRKAPVDNVARSRAAEGRLGVCVDCGGPIEYARLRVYASAGRCAECQTLHENPGARAEALIGRR